MSCLIERMKQVQVFGDYDLTTGIQKSYWSWQLVTFCGTHIDMRPVALGAMNGFQNYAEFVFQPNHPDLTCPSCKENVDKKHAQWAEKVLQSVATT